ncbi:hypothetical protein PM082_011212 [Marasmius tenuissimus]|nr:hypothetical protein PM082_011212 [Marasmius tenuissimus]
MSLAFRCSPRRTRYPVMDTLTRAVLSGGFTYLETAISNFNTFVAALDPLPIQSLINTPYLSKCSAWRSHVRNPHVRRWYSLPFSRNDIWSWILFRLRLRGLMGPPSMRATNHFKLQ